MGLTYQRRPEMCAGDKGYVIGLSPLGIVERVHAPAGQRPLWE